MTCQVVLGVVQPHTKLNPAMTHDQAPQPPRDAVDPTYLGGKPMSKRLRRVLLIYLTGLALTTIATISYLYKQHAKRATPPPVERAPIVAPEPEQPEESPEAPPKP